MVDTPQRIVPPSTRFHAIDPLSGFLGRRIRADGETYLIERYEVLGTEVRFFAVGPGKHERTFSTVELVRHLEAAETDLAHQEP